MLKKLIPLLAVSAITVIGLLNPVPLMAEGDSKAFVDAEKEKNIRPVPFHGRIYAVDPEAKTITLDGKERKRVLHVVEKTKIMKDGKEVKFVEAVPGEEVGGQARQVNGRLEVVSIRLGPKPETEPKTKTTREKKPSS